MGTVEDEVRRILSEQGRLAVDPSLVPREADLFGLGLTSHATVNVMLALEEAFDVEFPDSLLKKSTFSSVSSLVEVVGQLTAAPS